MIQDYLWGMLDFFMNYLWGPLVLVWFVGMVALLWHDVRKGQ